MICDSRFRGSGPIGRSRSAAQGARGYVAGDIKSGAGEEAPDDGGNGKPKKHYAVQLALYTVTSSRRPALIIFVAHLNAIRRLRHSRGTR